MTYTLTIVFYGQESISTTVDQDIELLPRKGEVVCLMYEVGKESGSEYFGVTDVVVYPQKRNYDGLDRQKSRVQVIVDGRCKSDDDKVKLIASPNNKYSLGEWTSGKMVSPSTWVPNPRRRDLQPSRSK